ncbi:hypothetical protein Taro_053962, partial [Colocasia esculenta]|nr:hypothetical protein [Colocasia esculenta]
RGYESRVYDLACRFLVTDGRGNIVDPRLKLGKVSYQSRGKKGQQTCKTLSIYNRLRLLKEINIGKYKLFS